MTVLPQCPHQLPSDITSLVENFAQAWASSPMRPKPSLVIVNKWAELLNEWAYADNLPLFIRKPSNIRGATVLHNSGRVLVPTDNSPAHWAYVKASHGECPSLDDIREMLEKDAIPVCMIQKAVERPLARYHCSLDRRFNVNKFGWKLAHIDSVGLKTRAALNTVPLQRLIVQFLSLMSPANMFVVPLSWAGFAELDVVIKAVATADQAIL